MIYGSVCSGIEAASAAWHPLGWRAAWFSEIEAFPSAVLGHHYPDVPNLGDMTKIHEREEFQLGAIDLLVGGTPCQSFSVAGLRKGMADPRGNLAIVFLSIAYRARPRWVVWENVPGVLSSEGGRDFGAFLGGLAELGYGFAYRVLDAQFLGVAQRRRRVFVVGYLGDWRRAAAVLFERASMSGHPPPRRKTREGVAGTLSARTKGAGGLGTDFDLDGGLISHAITGEGVDASEDGSRRGTPLVARTLLGKSGDSHADDLDTYIPVVSPAIKARDGKGPSSDGDGDGDGAPLIVTTLAIRGRAGGHQLETREDGTANAILTPSGGRAGIGVGAVAVFDPNQITSKANRSRCEADVSHTLPNSPNSPNSPIAFSPTDYAAGVFSELDHSTPITASRDASRATPIAAYVADVRRLTPRECERLQGFPDDYSLVRYNGKPAKDGPRYKAIGNSMAVPVMVWIGKRMQMVEDATKGLP